MFARLYRVFVRSRYPFLLSVTCIVSLNILAYALPINLLDFFGNAAINRTSLINYAPEVWLSLLALVFGTLIIVISIASESTPKLIDLFVGDYRSRFYIWVITLSSLENILLQLFNYHNISFFDNLIFLNNYVLLPCFILLAIPYIFYILKYTKSSNVINKIFEENLEAIQNATSIKNSKEEINQSHLALFETINQLHDLIQYVQFKGPKGDIINKFGKSLRFYIERKRTFSEYYFVLGHVVKNDISFKTLVEKFDSIEDDRTFYEQKVLRVFGASYQLLIQDSHSDLASLCGNELYETGKTALNLDDFESLNLVIVYFNTLLRYGISQGLKTKEIRNVYNTIFHYSQLVDLLILKGEEERIIQCCKYFAFYGNEVSKLSLSEPFFVFLIDSFATELKKILIALHENNFLREKQILVLKMYNDLSSLEMKRSIVNQRTDYADVRLIQIALCLFYTDKGEQEFNEITIDCVLNDLRSFGKDVVKRIITQDCDRIAQESEEFWEETDQGNRNIFYSRHKNQLSAFKSLVFSKIDQGQ